MSLKHSHTHTHTRTPQALYSFMCLQVGSAAFSSLSICFTLFLHLKLSAFLWSAVNINDVWTIQLPAESEVVMKVIMLLEHRLLVFGKQGGKLKCEAYFSLFCSFFQGWRVKQLSWSFKGPWIRTLNVQCQPTIVPNYSKSKLLIKIKSED